jgi:hypothetical protein
MANQVMGIYIRKEVTFQGKSRTFGNTYHFAATNMLVFSEAQYRGIIQKLESAEKAIHSSAVKFVEGALWGPTDNGNQADNLMRVRMSLSGNGTLAPGTKPVYREMAVMFRWALGRYGSKNRPQYLRKWIHPCSDFGVWTDAQMQGVDQISEMTAMTNYRTAVNTLGDPGWPDTALSFCTKDGRVPQNLGEIKPWLEHHQFGR